MRGCPEDTHAVLFALRRVILLRSYKWLRIVILSFGLFYANKKKSYDLSTPCPQSWGNRCFLIYANCSLQRAISYILKKHSASTPRSPNLGGEKVFFVISKIAHIASNFLYNKKQSVTRKKSCQKKTVLRQSHCKAALCR